MDKQKLVAACKSGRGFNGAHRDAGTVVHLVPAMPERCFGFWGDKALCGTEPGRRGNGWHSVDRIVTCEKCLKRQRKGGNENE